VLYLVAFSFSALGFLIAWKMESPQGFHAVMNLLLFPLWMVSGALFGFASAHGWMQWLMLANPLTYATAALRRLLAPSVEAGTPAMDLSILVTLACGILLWAAATLAARRKSGRSSA
jgi:ABC-type polysaccharide/polyol phosphate export permease